MHKRNHIYFYTLIVNFYINCIFLLNTKNKMFFQIIHYKKFLCKNLFLSFRFRFIKYRFDFKKDF